MVLRQEIQLGLHVKAYISSPEQHMSESKVGSSVMISSVLYLKSHIIMFSFGFSQRQ